MAVVCLRDKKVIEQFFRNDVERQIYSIGDLDDFFWPYTRWYALTGDDFPRAVALLYTGQTIPTLLAIAEQPHPTSDLLASIVHLLPQQFYAHLSPGLERVFADTFALEAHGEHYKMALRNRSAVNALDCSQVIRLSTADLDEILALYARSYPGNWFDQRMLGSDQYFGIRKNGRLVSIAGIHVYSESYRVAALGNITTDPAYRNRGYGKLVTAGLCRSLSKTVDHIGLNVKADNRIAISCYEKLGFEIVASYGEFLLQRRSRNEQARSV